MDSSSEGSFAWADASNDSSDDDNTAETNHNQSGEDSESGKTYKKGLLKYLFSDRGDDQASEQLEGNERRKRRQSDSIHSVKTKQVKAEPESDADRPKKKKKCSDLRQDRTNDIYDESFLDSKVKSEQSFVVPSPVKAKKRKKKSVSGANKTICNGDDDEPGGSSLSEPNGLSHGHITNEDFSTLGSGNEEEGIDNKYHIVKTKKMKKKSKEKSVSLEVDNVLNDSEEISSKARKSSVTEIQSMLADELSDMPTSTEKHTLPDNSSTTEESRQCVETVLNDNGNQNHYGVNSERVNSESSFTKHKSRMSERIQFEEDSDVQIKNNITNTATKQTEGKGLASFIEESSIHLRPVQVKCSKLSSALILTDDDDVWLIRCPNDVRLEAFQDQKWVLNSKCKIKLDGLTYEGDIGDTESNMTILNSTLGKQVIKNVKINGCIRLRRRLPKGHIQDDNIMVNNQTNFIPLPDTKCRHPLFGLSYKKDVKLPSRVAARLRAPVARDCTREMERSAQQEGAECGTITVKKRKHKSSKAGEHKSATRHKRTKRGFQPDDVWESEKAIEENLFNF